MRGLLAALWLPLLGSAALATGAETTGPKAEARPSGPQQPVLDINGFWRCFMVWKTEMVKTEKGEVLPVMVSAGSGLKVGGRVVVTATAPPSAGWTAPDFEDGSWGWIQGLGLAHRESSNRQLSTACLRGKFLVPDPAAVSGLSLDLAYHGGVVVYLNGKEVARGHMPEGQIGPDTFAEEYPRAVYVNEKGAPSGNKALVEARIRRLQNVTLPGSALVKGLNVLALELHRSVTDEIIRKAGLYADSGQWATLALKEVKLSGPAGPEIVPNVSRPKGFQVWPQSVVARVYLNEYGDAYAKAPLVRIVGCRNGTFAGQLVAGSTVAIKGLKATVGPLKPVKGDAAIPAEAVRVRYGCLPKPIGLSRHFPHWGGADHFEALEEESPAEVAVAGSGAVMPIRIAVRVPGDAKPGDYRGVVTVSADGEKPVEVPLELKVADWTLPDPQKFTGYVGLTQSPESVALRYGVELWSEEHWKLLDKTFALLGEVGNKEIYITAVCKTYFGNEHGMIKWVKKDGGGYDVDFSVAERYLDTALKHLKQPPVICLYAWDSFKDVLEDDFSPPAKRDTTPKAGAAFTIKDPKTGQLEYGKAPMWGAPESAAFWKPVIEGLKQRLEKRGLANSLMVGISHDVRPRAKEAVADFETACPGVHWVSQSHRESPGYMKTGLEAVVYTAGRFNEPAFERKYGWQRPDIHARFCRDDMKTEQPGLFRSITESLLTAGERGWSRAGADFWSVLKDAKGRWSGDLMHRYVNLFGMNVVFTDSTPALLAPGLKGPISTVRFEMVREGLQEAEARIFIEKALLDAGSKARLGPEFSERCQQMLDNRLRVYTFTGASWSGSLGEWALMPHGGWQEESAKLYALAGEVARKLEGK